jgi:hypothetical protein
MTEVNEAICEARHAGRVVLEVAQGTMQGKPRIPPQMRTSRALGIDPKLSSLLAMLSLLTCRRQAVRVRPQQLDWFRSRCPVHRVRCRGGRVQSGQRPALPRGRKPREDRLAS